MAFTIQSAGGGGMPQRRIHTGPLPGLPSGMYIDNPNYEAELAAFQRQQNAAPQQLTGTEQQAIAAYQQNQQTAQEQEKARFEKMMALAQQFGAGQMRRAEQLRGEEQAAGTANLINRGLFNSSTQTAVDARANDAYAQRTADVADRQATMQLGVLDQVQTRGPDMGLIAQLFGQQRANVALPLLQTSPIRLFDTPAAGGAGSASVTPKKKGK